MSVNHFSTTVPEIFWRTEPLRSDPVVQDPTSFDSNLNRHVDNFEETLLEDHRHERDLLFQKPLTPSDVGKLNRLVIPKQHAERCFPLGGLGQADSDSGMLLSFEDELGKCWRFRYSYWSSSQSYVLTKGWSRYVKGKKLDPGDVVLFERHRVNSDRLFIGWRRRDVAVSESHRISRLWTGAVTENGYEAGTSYTTVESNHRGNHAGSAEVDCMKDLSSSGNSKRFRLFGVNLEYQQQQSEDDDSSDRSQRHYHYPDTYHGNFFNYMDVNQMSN